MTLNQKVKAIQNRAKGRDRKRASPGILVETLMPLYTPLIQRRQSLCPPIKQLLVSTALSEQHAAVGSKIKELII